MSTLENLIYRHGISPHLFPDDEIGDLLLRYLLGLWSKDSSYLVFLRSPFLLQRGRRKQRPFKKVNNFVNLYAPFCS